MLFNYLFIFMIGSFLGFFLELFYRKITQNKWIKPGVFHGLYLPLYGVGVCVCYFVYNLNVIMLFSVLITVVLLTFIEFVCGLIFIKYFKIPLWDYSNNFINYKGLVCLKFSVYWAILGVFFIYFVFPFIDFIVIEGKVVDYIMFGFYSILVSDVIYSLFYLICNKVINNSL